jgi:radical SAM superfamily enzyme YgiQ (UPF0313 family)
MKICLIKPALKERKLLYEEGVIWKTARFIFNKVSRFKIGGGNDVPSLALMILAALTPSDFDVTIVDEGIEEIDFERDVDLVGITLLTMTALRGYEIADRFRKRGVKVVLGGMHATVLPKEAAQHADAVVIGEAERVWHQVLADAKAGKLKKFYSSKNFCDMREIPIPRRNLLPKKNYLTTNVIQTTRGCPNRCSFCSIHAITGNTYRYRPIPEVISELETFSSPWAVFVDDNIVGNPRHAKQLFKALTPMKLTWLGQATLAIAEDDELLDLAAKSGCKVLIIGFESLSEENIKDIGKAKTNKVSNYEKAIVKLHNHGICIVGNFILGLENDDVSVFNKTIEFIQKNNIDIPHTSVLTPYPGTRFFKKLKSEGRIIHKDWRFYGQAIGKPVFQPKLMTPEELEQGHRFVGEQIYSLRATTKRLLGVRKNLFPSIVFNLKRRKVFMENAKRKNSSNYLQKR